MCPFSGVKFHGAFHYFSSCSRFGAHIVSTVILTNYEHTHKATTKQSVWNGFYWQSKVWPPICAPFGTKSYALQKSFCALYDQSRLPSIWSAASAFWDWYYPWRNVWRWTMYQLEMSHQQRKSVRKYSEDFPFYGLWDAVFTAFRCNLSRDAFHKFLFGAQHSSLSAVDHTRQLFRCMFPGNGVSKEEHQNLITATTKCVFLSQWCQWHV